MDSGPEKNQGARVVKDQAEGLFGSGWNITTDNFFTGYHLGQFLLQNKLTLLGTMRRNRKELPVSHAEKNDTSSILHSHSQTTP